METEAVDQNVQQATVQNDRTRVKTSPDEASKRPFVVLAVVILARICDILSTYLVIRSKVGRERNPIVRLLGWRWWIIFNVIAIPIAAVQPLFFWPLVVFSAIATVWNLSLLRRKRG